MLSHLNFSLSTLFISFCLYIAIIIISHPVTKCHSHRAQTTKSHYTSSPNRLMSPEAVANYWLQQYHSYLSPSPSSSVARTKPTTYISSSKPIRHEVQQLSAADDLIYSPSTAREELEFMSIPANNNNNNDVSERYDYEYEDHHKKQQHHVEHHEEVKDMSYIYPVLLALLILGALFVPFISLFFFLAVSAFNCNSFGSGGFNQVTPFFGRRRRRRKRDTEQEAVKWRQQHTTTTRQQQVANVSADKEQTAAEQQQHLITLATEHTLPQLMLLDAIEENYESSEQPDGSLLEQRHLSDYEFWRKQVARSTVRLRQALIRFGANWNQDDGDTEQAN